MSVAFRRWAVEDLNAIPVVIWETWMEAYTPFIPKEDLKSFHDEFYNPTNVKKVFDDPNVNGFVAIDGKQVVGFVRTKYSPEEQRHYVSSLYILPAYQHKGIGSRLMEFAADEAKARGLDRVWLGVMVENRAGVDWYKRLGFNVHEEQPFTMGKTTVNHYIGYVMIASIGSMKKK